MCFFTKLSLQTYLQKHTRKKNPQKIENKEYVGVKLIQDCPEHVPFRGESRNFLTVREILFASPKTLKENPAYKMINKTIPCYEESSNNMPLTNYMSIFMLS